MREKGTHRGFDIIAMATKKSTHHIGYHRESTCLYPVIENIEFTHKTAEVRSFMDTLKISYFCVHRTAAFYEPSK